MFSISQAALAGVAIYLAYATLQAVYNLYFHPLRKFPGPKLRAALYFPHYWECYTGEVVHKWHELHERYRAGIIRISPNQLSVVNADAWKDIYGSATRKQIPKDPEIYANGQGGVKNILSPDDADHARIRRLLNPGFSEASTRAQEDLVSSYITLLMAKLRAKAASRKIVDIMSYLNWTTFDILGELCFSESFGALESETNHEWIETIFETLKYSRIFRPLVAYPIIGIPIMTVLQYIPWWTKWWAEVGLRQKRFTDQKVEKRMKTKTKRKDFMSHLLKDNGEIKDTMTKPEIQSTTSILIIAGSETLATFLSGAVFYLVKNPSWLSQLSEEVRASFDKESDITFTSSARLKILNAIAMEIFRIYPPAPVILPRRTTQQGAIVCGHFIPPNTGIGIAAFPAYHSSMNFKDPEVFAPQRWMDDAEYKDDKRTVVQPFSIGPRNCIGQSLGWSELRVILARLVWNFDIHLQEESVNWDYRQKTFTMWHKPPLMVKLTDRRSGE